MRTRVVSVLMLAVLVVASTGCDTTPPTFTGQLEASFVIGAQIERSDSEGDEEAYTWDIPRRLSWQAADDDADCQLTYDLYRVYAGAEPALLLDETDVTQFDLLTNDYDGTFGGGSGATSGWNVVAHDCAGNARESPYPRGSKVWQEDGFAPFPPHFPEPTVEYTGAWTNQTGPWASGGRQRFTSEVGASVSFATEFIAHQHVGLVMAKGPGRGSAEIRVDGVAVGTVNTYAPVNDNRRVVFDQRMDAGVHTIEIVNLATAGHPRIDVDAFLT